MNQPGHTLFRILEVACGENMEKNAVLEAEWTILVEDRRAE